MMPPRRVRFHAAASRYATLTLVLVIGAAAPHGCGGLGRVVKPKLREPPPREKPATPSFRPRYLPPHPGCSKRDRQAHHCH